MLGYVTQRELDEERDRRINAEATSTALQKQVDRLLEMIDDLLERALPKPVPGFGIPPGLAERGLTSSTEILKMPAVGKRGVRERNAAARLADVRDEAQANADDFAKRRATLSADEQAALDKLIPR